jgi:hypothetical protein
MEYLYPISGLFFYRLIFMFWLLFGEGLFVFRFKKKKHFVVRTLLAILACFLFALAFPIPTSNAFYLMIMFLLMFVFTYFASMFLFEVEWKMLLFSMISGYTIEQIAYETYFAFNNFLNLNQYQNGGMYSKDTINLFSGPLDQFIYFACYIVVYWVMFVLFANRIKGSQEFDSNSSKSNLKFLVIGIFFLSSDIVISSAVSFYATIHYENIYMGIISIVIALCCLIGLFFLFEMFYGNNLKHDMEIVKEIRKEEKNQYQISKETIDLINIKCHDFRHQIRKLGKEQNIQESAIENVNKLINIYDSSIKTSNDTLNVILTEKSLICAKNGIKFSCIADGMILNFMTEEDIYSLFGNIIDNAIEAVNHLSDDKKIITLRIKSIGNMISISEKNSYDNDIHLINGLPRSNKNDTLHHGFGLKSIKLICEKYHGTMQINYDNNIFNITLLFIPSNLDK